VSGEHLPHIEDLSKFGDPLALQGRVSEDPKDGWSHSRFFTPLNPSRTIMTLGLVVTMFAISPDFTCTVSKQQGQNTAHFTVNCDICGDRSSVSVIYPATDSGLSVSTRPLLWSHVRWTDISTALNWGCNLHDEP
jgi:hypothetical protein